MAVRGQGDKKRYNGYGKMSFSQGKAKEKSGNFISD